MKKILTKIYYKKFLLEQEISKHNSREINIEDSREGYEYIGKETGKNTQKLQTVELLDDLIDTILDEYQGITLRRKTQYKT